MALGDSDYCCTHLLIGGGVIRAPWMLFAFNESQIDRRAASRPLAAGSAVHQVLTASKRREEKRTAVLDRLRRNQVLITSVRCCKAAFWQAAYPCLLRAGRVYTGMEPLRRPYYSYLYVCVTFFIPNPSLFTFVKRM